MPKLPRFLRFERSRSEKGQLQAECSNATGVSSSSPRTNPGAAAPKIFPDCASPPAHDSQAVTSLVEWDSAQTLGPHSSVAPPSTHTASLSQTVDSGSFQHQNLLVVPQQSPAAGSQPSLLSRQSTPPPRQHSPRLRDGNSSTLYVENTHESRNVSVEGDMNHVNYTHTNTVVNNSHKFMAELLEETIPGAAFDSSARDPPPRCHPGTRLAILARCLEFIANAIDEKKMRWVVGAAGVGKSAIMQNVAEFPPPSVSQHVSIFFSINGRNNGTKAIITLAYQLAAKCEPYRVLIEYEITRDPSLLQSVLPVQFKKFVIEPFIHHPILRSLGRVLIIMDGLDECDKSHTQRELLRLISEFCLTYPSSPIVWFIASRPESHITFFFAQDHVKAVYEKEEILVDSDEAGKDVERFLRNELTRIQYEFSLSPRSQWPQEQDLWKLANASGGLFVFADTVIKYIGDPTFGKPTSQLDDVLKVIVAHPLPNLPQEQHPMARLSALYAQILSKVPERIMVDTRKMLLALVFDSSRRWSFRGGNFLVLCNWLGMTCDDAYAAIRHLCSVLDCPSRDKAHATMLRSFHKSFMDYISDFTRSGLSSDIEHEAYQLEVQCTLRILEQAPDGIASYYMANDTILRGSDSLKMGVLARGPGTGDDISLTWPVDEQIGWSDNKTRLNMYKLAVANVVEGIKKREPAFCTEFCIRLVAARWHSYHWDGFPFRELQHVVFERSRRDEFIKHGILKQRPIKEFNLTEIWHTRLHLRRPTATVTNLSDPWTPTCQHSRTGDWGETKDEDWTTEFGFSGGFLQCHSCHLRLKQQLKNCKSRSPEHLATILFTSTPKLFAEFEFIDPDDDVSEWTYWFVCDISCLEPTYGSPHVVYD